MSYYFRTYNDWKTIAYSNRIKYIVPHWSRLIYGRWYSVGDSIWRLTCSFRPEIVFSRTHALSRVEIKTWQTLGFVTGNGFTSSAALRTVYIVQYKDATRPTVRSYGLRIVSKVINTRWKDLQTAVFYCFKLKTDRVSHITRTLITPNPRSA